MKLLLVLFFKRRAISRENWWSGPWLAFERKLTGEINRIWDAWMLLMHINGIWLILWVSLSKSFTISAVVVNSWIRKYYPIEFLASKTDYNLFKTGFQHPIIGLPKIKPYINIPKIKPYINIGRELERGYNPQTLLQQCAFPNACRSFPINIGIISMILIATKMWENSMPTNEFDGLRKVTADVWGGIVSYR